MQTRPATDADIAAFYGEARVPVRLIAIGDPAVGIGGLAWCEDGVWAVSWFKPEAKSCPKAILRAAAAVRKMIEEVGGPVYAHNDEEEPTADRFLRHLGFERDGDHYEFRSR
jgi:hypothetical protein